MAFDCCEQLGDVNSRNGYIIRGGYGSSGITDIISVVKIILRERANTVPVLGLCLGFQVLHCIYGSGRSAESIGDFSTLTGDDILFHEMCEPRVGHFSITGNILGGKLATGVLRHAYQLASAWDAGIVVMRLCTGEPLGYVYECNVSAYQAHWSNLTAASLCTTH